MEAINTIILLAILVMLLRVFRKPGEQPRQVPVNHEIVVTQVANATNNKAHLVEKPMGDDWTIYDIRLMQNGTAKVIWIRQI